MLYKTITDAIELGNSWCDESSGYNLRIVLANGDQIRWAPESAPKEAGDSILIDSPDLDCVSIVALSAIVRVDVIPV